MKAAAYFVIGILIVIIGWIMFGGGLISVQPMEPSDEAPAFRSYDPDQRDNDHRERGGPTRRDDDEE